MKAWLRIFTLGTLALAFTFSAFYFRRVPDPLLEGKYASAWCEELLSGDYKARSEAQRAVVALGEAAVPQLRVMLRRRNPAWEPWLARAASHVPQWDYRIRDSVAGRMRAAEALAALGPRGAGAVGDLIEAMDHERVAPEAARALLKIEAAAEPALREAAERHSNTAIRIRAAGILGEIEPFSPENTASLIEAARDNARGVRRQAALSLAGATELADEARETLIRLLRDDSAEVRGAAAIALGQREETSAHILAGLEQALDDSSAEVRLESAKALWRLGAESDLVLPVLMAMLYTDQAWRAAYALADMRESAAPAIPHLIAALRQERVYRPFRTPPSSAFALGRIGAPAVPALTQVLGAAQAHARMGAVLALGFIGQSAASAVPALLPLLADEDSEVRHAAALTLGTLGADSDQVISALGECLRAEDIHMRFAAADLLRQIEPAGTWNVSPE